MKRSDFRYLERLRVRWAEVDAQQVVFNGHYLLYLDTAVTGYWRALALPYADTAQRLGGEFFVRRSTLDHRRPARFDDLLDIGLRCAGFGTSSMTLAAGIFRDDELLATGELVYVFADPQAVRSQPVPEAFRALLLGFDAGEPAVEVRTGSWGELGDAARALRTEVFVQEQHVPAALEWDEADEGAVHALAFNRLGLPLATGRLLVEAPGVGRIGRMAVHRAVRGGSIGRQVLDALMQAARERGDREVTLHAQVRAKRFYARAGFIDHGPEFEEAGIVHQTMSRPL